MPSLENPFESVLTEKEWTKARDKSGLSSGLTEKVSVGKELSTFHQAKDAPAARRLLEKLALYEQVLKAKHAKEKYYQKLLKLIQDQQEAAGLGVTILENAPIIADVRQRIRKIVETTGSSRDRIQDQTQTKDSETAFKQRFAAIRDRSRELAKKIPEDAFLLPGDVVEAVVHLERDYQQLEADLEKEGADDNDEDAPESGGGSSAADRHWAQTLVPYLIGIVNKALSKHPDLILNGSVDALFAGLLAPVRAEHQRNFDVKLIKPITSSLTPDPNDPVTTQAVKHAAELLKGAIDTALQQQTDTPWFQFVRETAPTPKTDSPTKSTSFEGAGSEAFDDKKAYASLLMKLSALKGDCRAAAQFLGNAKQLSIIFPYEQTEGKKEVDPNNKRPSVLTKLATLGGALVAGIGTVRASLGAQPPNLQAARNEYARLDQAATQIQVDLPRHGDVVERGVKLFILKPLEDEITAKSVGN